ncbi:MAG: YggS family pyridoxal phosphate-dependent enzyme [Actinobacteria bacterium]|nr:YggS family pyridoxal phosphate-dependent enzyme [Actinomycetota bacterium]
MGIAENLQAVRERIAAAAMRAGRETDSVRLVAVSKGRSLEAIREAMRAGQKAFGENRAQELREKALLLGEDVEWHFVGHLQRNKVNMVVGKAALIHSLDSRRLAAAISARALALGTVQDVLVQVNVSGEETKSGVEESGAADLVGEILSLPGLRVRGLMTIAPVWAEGEKSRPFFRALRELRDTLREAYPRADLSLLSMGMTQDFEVAVEEGADLVRVGTAIFAD